MNVNRMQSQSIIKLLLLLLQSNGYVFERPLNCDDDEE